MKYNISENKCILSLLIILLIIFLHYSNLFSPIESLVSLILSPFQGITYSLSTGLTDKFAKIQSKENLNSENLKLKQQIENLEQQIVDLKLFIEENKMLEKQQEYLNAQGFEFINTRVISQSVDNDPNLLIINKGSLQGIENGMAAVTEVGIIIGKIIKTEKFQAWLRLLIHNESSLSASIAGQSEIVGLVQGEHNISISLNNILKAAPLKQGDLIITSGFDDYIPSGLLIGEVDEIIDEQSELFKHAILKSQTNFKNLKIVSIILK